MYWVGRGAHTHSDTLPVLDGWVTLHVLGWGWAHTLRTHCMHYVGEWMGWVGGDTACTVGGWEVHTNTKDTLGVGGGEHTHAGYIACTG